MDNRPNGIVRVAHALLANKYAYASYQFCVGGTRYRDKLVKANVLKFTPTQVVDMGCGPGNSLNAIPQSTTFIGIDLSTEYLELALKNRATSTLIHGDVVDSEWMESFEHKAESLYFAMGLFHHLSDEQLFKMFSNLYRYFPSAAKIFSVDPTIVPSSSRVARWFANNDRGRYIRDPEGLSRILRETGFESKASLASNSFNIPLDTVELLITKAG